MEREMQSLIDNKTWKLVELRKDQTVIDSKWVYKLKDNPAGDEAGIFKARLVARGFTHEKRVDYNEVFSLVAKYATIRLVCALAATISLVINQMNVVTAFLYGYLEEEIYMRQPIGFEVKGHERPDIALAMGKMSKYMSNLGKVHLEAVKWILRYLKNTVDYGLLFNGLLDNAKSLFGYVDVDYRQDLDKSRSITGYVFTLGGGSISWGSILQKCVAQSTIEAEYVAATEAAKEAIWLDRLIMEMGLT
ncbi:hypothetical protein AXG93_246s1000 [Marchantia polymorpha subsp. ruderalis]|uniref:Reverse transcriptase Ty1/copia-type domain-containing protein n=1 Tax=Marchantia polymorpha subsp. ruderalis TaxID=1480154 RepID=A0A176WAQ7_MARPO|nr:hypothetical protein AXG93_246s1000 [Marchantia polymorpha subsp. ruderalis]